ncbi:MULTISPECIES: DUF305 domain-containing protein [Hymenobacter]|uniref:DUF305 domain-containing protein n=1 Tax=Hymenobacter rigui TaxID=334424 RepID=A0A428KGA0_9BACT|nr:MULTISPECIES: DUF305 domain-containing protein [Hymenobacter]RSK45517.1 DUF305 domain-containing protein [Hymenobacter rigui]UYZ65275.1 DUF305 domain-containing protein [Hymenobacter sp. YIM 151500-1]
MNKGSYSKFFLMLAASFVVMHLITYLNTYEWDHIYFSINRFYMTTLMVAAMGLLMLAFMAHMYPDKGKNRLIAVGCVAVFAAVLAMLRNQVLVNDTRFMQSMIPHHSIAILVSKRATIKDPEVRTLADSIISAQQREIGQMKRMLHRLQQQ